MRIIPKNDYVFSILNKMITALTGFVIAAFINRYLGPSLKGEYAYIMNVVNILAIAGNLGIYQSYPKSYKDNLDHCKDKYVTLVLLIFCIYSTVAIILGIISKEWVMFVSCLLVPTQITANQLSMVEMVEEIRYRQIIQIGTLLLKTVVIIAVAIINVPYSLLVVLTIILCVNILQCVFYLLRLRSVFSLHFLNQKFIKYAISFGAYAVIADLLLIFNYRADVLMLKYFVDYYQIGLYSVGVGIAECLWLIPDAFKEVLFSRTSRGNPIAEINLTIKINVFISIVLIAFLYIFGKQVILIYSGSAYLEALSVMKLLLIGVPAMSLFKVTNPLYLANGKQKLYCYILIVSVLINIVSNYLTIPRFGITGAAVSSVVSFSACGVLFYYFYIKEYAIKWYEPLLLRKRDIESLMKSIRSGE